MHARDACPLHLQENFNLYFFPFGEKIQGTNRVTLLLRLFSRLTIDTALRDIEETLELKLYPRGGVFEKTKILTGEVSTER